MIPQNINFTPEEEQIMAEVDQELDKRFWRELGLPEPTSQHPQPEPPKEEEQQPDE